MRKTRVILSSLGSKNVLKNSINRVNDEGVDGPTTMAGSIDVNEDANSWLVLNTAERCTEESQNFED